MEPTDLNTAMLAIVAKHPKCSIHRIYRMIPDVPTSEITQAIDSLVCSQRIDQDPKGKLRIIKDAERAAFNTKRKNLFHNDEHHRILRRTRTKMIRLLNHGKPVRCKKFAAILGCTLKEFAAYLETQFAPGMSWSNHGVGTGKWHIDHIKPCAEHDLTKPEDFAACWHHTNMRPLWASENLRLGAKGHKRKPV